ncbi:MAG TPA: helix-turn-helix transcriptional regulator [Solirubrobacteraceae bacterium]|jgi:transcriptional regulator with XRE-family HTH domain
MNGQQHFGANLARARERRGLSQSQLAREVDVLYTYISRIETGKAAPSFGLILRLAAALELPPSDLFAGIR